MDQAQYLEAMRVLFETAPQGFDEAEEGPAAIALRAVLFSAEEKLTPPDWAVVSVLAAMKRYDSFEVGSVNEAFGFPWNTRLDARRNELRCAYIAHLVEQKQAAAKQLGLSLPLASSKCARGALDLVGEDLNMAAATVAKYRNMWRAHCKRADRDATVRVDVQYGNAQQAIFNAVAVALGSPKEFSKGILNNK